MSIIHIENTAQFEEEILKGEEAAIVDFWAEWCGPCKMISPIIDEISEEYDGKIKIAKVNVDSCQDLAMSYQVMSIPTILILKNGEVINQSIGVKSKDAIIDMFKDNI